MSLTDIKCKSLQPKEKSYKVFDEKSLYLEISPAGKKYWRFKYRFAGKENRLSFGAYPEVTLKEAREKRDKARRQITDGINPSQAKKLEKLQTHINHQNNFENIARQWHEKQTQRWTERHSHYVLKRLEADVFKEIGNRPITEITPPELLAVIRKIEDRGAIDIAHRALQTCGQIFRYAIATGKATNDISKDLRGALTTRKKTGYSKLEEKELPQFLERLEKYDGKKQTELALKFLILTFVRTKELRGARWDEFDFEKKEWHIPAERMKMREKHIVPLSKQVLELLPQIRELHNNQELVFPSQNNPHKPISENTLLYAMYRMGYHSRATPHGFRATASTILNEKGFDKDHIERQLAHGDRDQIRASYNYAQYLPQRAKMMQWWGDYLDTNRLKKC